MTHVIKPTEASVLRSLMLERGAPVPRSLTLAVPIPWYFLHPAPAALPGFTISATASFCPYLQEQTA